MTRALKRRHADYPETISLNTIEEVPPDHDQSTIRPTRKWKNFWHRKAIRFMRLVIALGCFVFGLLHALSDYNLKDNIQTILPVRTPF